MYNWSTDTTELQKTPDLYAIWRLEQLINFGLNGEKLDRSNLVKYWDRLDIDPAKRRALEFLFSPHGNSH